ncbi:MAG: hypothetical protein ACPGOV_11765 [Magnetovibrionaceae bacterium]
MVDRTLDEYPKTISLEVPFFPMFLMDDPDPANLPKTITAETPFDQWLFTACDPETGRPWIELAVEAKHEDQIIGALESAFNAGLKAGSGRSKTSPGSDTE